MEVESLEVLFTKFPIAAVPQNRIVGIGIRSEKEAIDTVFFSGDSGGLEHAFRHFGKTRTVFDDECERVLRIRESLVVFPAGDGEGIVEFSQLALVLGVEMDAVFLHFANPFPQRSAFVFGGFPDRPLPISRFDSTPG